MIWHKILYFSLGIHLVYCQQFLSDMILVTAEKIMQMPKLFRPNTRN